MVDKKIYHPLKFFFFCTCKNNFFLCKKDGVSILSNQLQNHTCSLEFFFVLFCFELFTFLSAKTQVRFTHSETSCGHACTIWTAEPDEHSYQ